MLALVPPAQPRYDILEPDSNDEREEHKVTKTGTPRERSCIEQKPQQDNI